MGRERKQERKTQLNGTKRQGVENKNRISRLFIIVYLSFHSMLWYTQYLRAKNSLIAWFLSVYFPIREFWLFEAKNESCHQR